MSTFKITNEHYTKELLDSDPNTLYVFGDNNLRIGKGGQAIIRDCDNSLGVTTKRAPTKKPDAYMTGNLQDVFKVVDDLYEVIDAVSDGIPVVWPASGIGTGLAELRTRAPKLLALIEAFKEAMLEASEVKNGEDIQEQS